MNRCCVQDDDNLSANTNRLLSNNTLHEKKAKLRSEAREQCCFCLLFSGAVVGTSVTAGASHGMSLSSQVPAIVVSSSSAYMCFNQFLDKRKSINEIDLELQARENSNVKYVDNFSNMSIYSINQDTLRQVHNPII